MRRDRARGDDEMITGIIYSTARHIIGRVLKIRYKLSQPQVQTILHEIDEAMIRGVKKEMMK